jgi:general secretion pathway protein F
MGRKALVDLTEALAVLIRSGIPLEEALQIARDTSDQEPARALLGRVLDRVRNGADFSTALEAEGHIFPPLYLNIVRTSEASGSLEQGLAQLSEYLQSENRVRDEVTSALLYPMVLSVVALISIGLILTYVVPRISELFVGYEDMLPLSTVLVISAADFVGHYWWVILLVVLVLLVLLRQQLRSEAGRLRWDRWVLRLPLLGDLVTKMEVARLSRSLATMLGNGVPLINALPLARGAMSNRALAGVVEAGVERLRDGGSFSSVFEDAAHFPALALQLITVGEKTGELDAMLARVALIYENEVAKASKRLLAILEPVLIVGLGVVIGAIIMSIMVAIISVNDLPL